jgi:hypothetical protein
MHEDGASIWSRRPSPSYRSTANVGRPSGDGTSYKLVPFDGALAQRKADAGGLDIVLYEQVRSHAGVDASHAYGGWLAILTAWCELHGIPYQGVPVGTIKRHIAGKGNADKQEVIDAVRKLGFAPADDNEADALALLNWAIAQGLGEPR